MRHESVEASSHCRLHRADARQGCGRWGWSDRRGLLLAWLLFVAGAPGCGESREAPSDVVGLAGIPAAFVPAFVQLYSSAYPGADPASPWLPDLVLWPRKRTLHVSGWLDGPVSRFIQGTVTVPDGIPLAMGMHDPSAVAVAMHADDGRTVVRTWTWDPDQSRLVAADELLFEGQAGTVTSLEFDPRTGALLLLDAEQGRLLEVMGVSRTRTLADAGEIPGLLGKLTLDVFPDPGGGPAGPATLKVTSIPVDIDTVGAGDEVLDIRDLDPTDGHTDGWVLSVIGP